MSVEANRTHVAFDGDWLALREPWDTEARSDRLTGLARDWLAERGALNRVLDLGSGTGSNLRYLAGRLAGPQRWYLVDQDAALLSQARASAETLRSLDGDRVEVDILWRNLTFLDEALFDDADLVVASALLDLVSDAWVETLVSVCARNGQALLVTLSIDGDWAFVDRHGQRVDDAEDTAVRALFQAHQRHDKGFGPALGGDAPSALGRALVRAGYHVETDASPWWLPAGDESALALARSVLAGWRDAAMEQVSDHNSGLHHWYDRRLADLEAGRVGLYVGHQDILATPSGAPPS